MFCFFNGTMNDLFKRNLTSIFLIITYKMQKIIIWSFLFMGISSFAQEQKTLELSMKEAEAIFIDQNLALISNKYNINVKEAQLRQNQLWPNPQLNLELAVWDGDDKQWFRNDYNAQRVVAIEQEIIVGGKRRSQKKLDQIEIDISELEYSDLIRTLKKEVRLTFAEFYYSNKKVEKLKQGIEPLEGLVYKYQAQYEKGNTSKTDIIRLKTLLLSLQKQYLDERNNLAELDASLKVLLNIKHDVNIVAVYVENNFNHEQVLINNDTLLESALINRPDIQILDKEKQYALQQIDREKKEAIPNLTLGALYDRRGAAQNDYVGLTLGTEIPIFDRNQGNIQKAKIEADKAEIDKLQQLEELHGEVAVANKRYWLSQEIQNSIDDSFYTDLESVLQSSLNQFSKKNMSLLEFVDFYESVEEGIEQFIEIQLDSIQSKEEINFVSGKDIFNNPM